MPSPSAPLRRALAAALLLLLAASPVSRAADAPPAAVHLIRLPEKDLVPDAAIDSKGVLHVVYGNDHIAYHIASRDNGTTFSAPVRINSEGTVETEMGERGPKLALGQDDSLHVVWVDKWQPGVKTAVRYARSLDGGQTFSPRQTLSSMNGVDGLTVAADNKGRVLAFWHVMQGPEPPVPQATYLFLARSLDNGAHFAANEPLAIDNLSSLACSMCMMRARVLPDGNVYLAFRSAQDNIRDFFVLKSPPDRSAFTALRVNTDNWQIPTCPMCGPEMTVTPDGRALVAFMSRHKVYWSLATPQLDGFALHVATPQSQNDEIYPAAIANKAGQILFLWQVGPMSTHDTATVHWAVYHADGSPTAGAGTAGKSYSGTKPTAFVGTDDAFYILTTAR